MMQKFVYSNLSCSLFAHSQPEDAFIKMASLKIDFLFFKQLKNHVLIYLTGATQIKTPEYTETKSYFYSFTYEKNIFSSQFILAAGRFFFKFVGRQKSRGFNTKIFSACLIYKPGFYFFSLHKIQISKQHSLIN